MGKSVIGTWASSLAVLALCSLGLPQVSAAQADAPKPAPSDGNASPDAAGKAVCSVRVIHATAVGTDFDARLEPLRPQLKGQAFQSFTHFALLKQHELSIAGGATQSFDMPGEHQGVLAYEGRADASGKHRLRLRLEIQDGKAKLLSTKFVINDGGTVMQAGLKYDKGVLVLGITCRSAG
jgi:hypothetical protein